ncbi:hypothetical protein [Streptomyces sp. NPDC085665]|uniref:hypothetical protein n=1 Tax=Streptomyces sp. NPDC085665 TaxID=3365735 RepID=UPI0037D583F6
MPEPTPFRHVVALVIGATLGIVGAVLVSFAVFGGSTGDDPRPGPTPSPSTTCSMFDPECSPGGSGGTGPTPTPASPGPRSTPAPTSPGGSGGFTDGAS